MHTSLYSIIDKGEHEKYPFLPLYVVGVSLNRYDLFSATYFKHFEQVKNSAKSAPY